MTTETILSALSDMWCHTKLISSSLSLCSHHCSGLDHHGRRKQVAARQRHQSQGGGKERARSTQGKPTKTNSTGAPPARARATTATRWVHQTIIPGWADWFLGWSRAGRRAAKRKAREIGVARVAHDTFRKIDAMWNYGVIQLLGDEVTKPTT